MSSSSSADTEGTCLSKKLEKTVCLQCERRKKWIREIRGERLQRIAKSTNSASRLASSSAASFPGRNECLGTHYSLIEQEEREDNSRQICERDRGKRKHGGKDKARREEKWQTCWCCRDQQTACKMEQASAEKLKHTKPAEKEEMPQCHKDSSWQGRQSRLCQKENKAICSDHQIVRWEGVEVSESCTLAGEEGRIRSMVDSIFTW